MPRFAYETVDVFTDRPFGGNPLAVFTDARGMTDAQMQALAAEMNYSETTFVLPADDPAHDARVRIFHRTAEMPFAGHPNVGTAWILARQDRDRGGVLRFEQMAGLVEIAIDRDSSGKVTGAVIAAPQPLSLGLTFTAEEIAPCAGLAAADVVTTAHRPVQASVGVPFVLAQVSPAALAKANPDLASFRALAARHLGLAGRLSLFLYVRDGSAIRACMFAPLAGTWRTRRRAAPAPRWAHFCSRWMAGRQPPSRSRKVWRWAAPAGCGCRRIELRTDFAPASGAHARPCFVVR